MPSKKRNATRVMPPPPETMSVSTVKRLAKKATTDKIIEYAEFAVGPKPPVGAKPSKADSLPIVSEFERADMDLAISLMKDDINLAEQEAAIQEERRLLKKELGEIAEKYGTEGMRWGQLATYVNRNEGRATLDATLLVENGVPAEVVKASYKTGKPFTTVRVVDLSAPKKSHRDRED